MHRRAFLPAMVALTVLLSFALASCGGGLTGGSSGSPGSQQPGSASLNGCKTQQAPSNLPPADVVLTGAGQGSTPTSDFTTHGKVKQGQTLEIHLTATVNWQMSTSPDAHVLQVEDPQSWYDAPDTACVWRMKALGNGETKFEFTGGLVCPPQQACPAIAALARFDITVS